MAKFCSYCGLQLDWECDGYCYVREEEYYREQEQEPTIEDYCFPHERHPECDEPFHCGGIFKSQCYCGLMIYEWLGDWWEPHRFILI